MIKLKNILIFLSFFVLFPSFYVAQSSGEDAVKLNAQKYFDEENYKEALPLYSQLLSLYPKDPNYNYKYGACYLFATTDKDKALKYLQFAVSKPNVEPLAYYYMARAYHHNYQFELAITYYNKFKSKTSTKDHQKYDVGRQIEMCQNGEKLITNMLKKLMKIPLFMQIRA